MAFGFTGGGDEGFPTVVAVLVGFGVLGSTLGFFTTFVGLFPTFALRVDLQNNLIAAKMAKPAHEQRLPEIPETKFSGWFWKTNK